VKAGWKLKTLGEIYDVRDGTHDSPKYQDEGYPLITSKNLKTGRLNFERVKFISEEDYLSINRRSKVNKGDLLFAMIGTIGNPTLVEVTPNFAIKNVALLKPPENQSVHFLKYYLETKIVMDQMKTDAKGTTQKFVGLNYLRNFQIPLPPLEEQKRIVSILDEAFQGLDRARENAEANLKSARELFSANLQSTLDPKGKIEWEIKSLGDICEFIGGGTPSKDKPEFYSGQIPWATVRDMMNDHLTKTDHSITQAGLSASSSKLIPGGEIVIASRVGLGKVCVLGQDTAINQDLRAVIPKDINSVEKRFLFHWFKSVAGTIEKAGTGATVKGVKLPFLKSLQIPLPPLEEQKRIVFQLDKMSTEYNSLEALYTTKIQDISDLRQSLLQKAFAGELT